MNNKAEIEQLREDIKVLELQIKLLEGDRNLTPDECRLLLRYIEQEELERQRDLQ